MDFTDEVLVRRLRGFFRKRECLEPVPGVHVTATSIDTCPHCHRPWTTETYADSKGRFTLDVPSLPAGEYRLRVDSPAIGTQEEIRHIP